MESAASVLLEDLCFTEGPRWRDGRLWFSDMHDLLVKTVDLDGKADEVVRVAGSPSGLGWLPDGRLLVVSMTDRKLLRLDPDGLAVHADLAALAAHHCNDMLTDASGRSYVGNFGFDLHESAKPQTTDLLLVTAEGDARIAASDLSFPNGTVLTPDGGTLIVGETFAGRLTAFDVAADGSLSNRRVWAQLEGAVPDGICLDAEGAIWVASPTGNVVLRVEAGGRVTHRVNVSQLAIACMLGGPEGRHLLCCTAPTVDPDECRAKRAARIEVVEVEIPHAGLP